MCCAASEGVWESLDDVIMGGRSSSAWQKGVGGGVLEQQSGKTFGRWAGTLVTEGGGFCGTVVKVRCWLVVDDSPSGAVELKRLMLGCRINGGDRYSFVSLSSSWGLRGVLRSCCCCC